MKPIKSYGGKNSRPLNVFIKASPRAKGVINLINSTDLLLSSPVVRYISMNKTIIGSLIGAAALAASAGVAFAESDGLHVGVSSDLEVKAQMHGGDDGDRGHMDAGIK